MRKLTVLRGAEQIAPLFYGVSHLGKFIGGYVRYMVSPNLSPAEAGDIDIYPNDVDCVESIKSWIQTYVKLEKDKSGGMFHETPISVTYTPAVGPKIQIIKPVNQGAIVAHGTLEQILNNFDFTVCRAGLLSLTEALVDDSFVEDELKHRLVIKSIHCPIGAIKRIAKYSKKGYYISPSELYKLFSDWDSRSADYKQELREAIAAFEDMKSQSDEGDGQWAMSDTSVTERMAQLIYVD